MHPVVHFEMPCHDRARVQAFYTSVFGWRMHELGAEMGHYVVAHTAETGDDGMVRAPGAINGGFFVCPEGQTIPPSVVIAVQGTDAMLERALAAGATRSGEAMDIPGVGRYASFVDPEGTRVGLLTPSVGTPASAASTAAPVAAPDAAPRPSHRQIYVNLPVADLPRSRAFFEALGYAFDPTFSNDSGACLVLGDHLFAMLLTRPFFATFTGKTIVDAHDATEVLTCLSCDSVEQIHALVERAVAAGGRAPRAFQDHGFMAQHAFEDLDGHVWELVWMRQT